MARDQGAGSISKEFPIDRIDATLRAITPGMTYGELREFARLHTQADIPGVLRKRFLLMEGDEIVYDLFLSHASSEGFGAPRIRKIMFFVWVYRTVALRRFITEVVADRSGHWRVSQLARRRNYEFLEQFVSESTAIKARSNLQNFLTEVGIYRANDGSIHLELDDGWVADAVAVASQHEPDPSRREQMNANPADYLINSRLNGLANASPDELRVLPLSARAARDPREDDVITTGSPSRSTSRRWNRRPPGPVARGTVIATRDPILLERANAAHHQLEVLLNSAATVLGYLPQQNEHIDMHFETPSSHVLAEMKSCHQNNVHSQIRRGISQILEYRYLYRDRLGDDPVCLLVLEIRPGSLKEWLVDFAQSLGIVIVWRQQGETDRLVTTGVVPAAVNGIVSAP